jgi:hypothetical protein
MQSYGGGGIERGHKFQANSILRKQCRQVARRGHAACFASSPRRPDREYKRMVFEHTHGLFIT